jgi:hypothetical protein
MAYNHPPPALKPESANIAKNGTVTVSFTCSDCFVHTTKEFLGRTPEAAPEWKGQPRPSQMSYLAGGVNPGFKPPSVH